MQFLKFFKYNFKKITLFFIALFSFLQVSVYGQSQREYTIVLDAGHGGKDPGNLGNGYREKNIALKVVLAVGKELSKTPGINVIYTRKTDRFVELHNRAKIANKHKADLFVSVHCDSYTKESVHGAGTFVLGLKGNSQNFEIAKRENAVILLEDNYEKNYDYDLNSPESVIGLSVLQEENLDESLALAGIMQDNFLSLKRLDRSVKQDNFLVLRETIMPSVLVELGFLTNRSEGKFLDSKLGQFKMAKAIAKSIKKYIEQLKLNTIKKDRKAPEITVAAKRPSKENEKEKKITDVVVQESKKPEIKESIKPVAVKEAPKKIEKSQVKKRPKNNTSIPDAKPKNVVKSQPIKTNIKTTVAPYIEFKVQIAASKKYLEVQPYNFDGLQDVEVMVVDGYYKYYYGSSSDFQSIKEILKEVRAAGRKDAFVVAFENGVKIPLREAIKKQ